MIIHSMSVEPVFGWLFGCTEYWLGEVMGGMSLHYLKADFEWWVKNRFGEIPTVVLLIHEEECELWVIAYLIEKGF